MSVGAQCHSLATLPEKKSRTHCIGWDSESLHQLCYPNPHISFPFHGRELIACTQAEWNWSFCSSFINKSVNARHLHYSYAGSMVHWKGHGGEIQAKYCIAWVPSLLFRSNCDTHTQGQWTTELKWTQHDTRKCLLFVAQNYTTGQP